MTISQTNSLRKLFIEQDYKKVLKEKTDFLNRREIPGLSFRFQKLKNNTRTPINQNFSFQKQFLQKKKNFRPKNNFYKKKKPFVINERFSQNSILKEFENKNENKYNLFFENFGKNLKKQNIMNLSNISFNKYKGCKDKIDFCKTTSTFV